MGFDQFTRTCCYWVLELENLFLKNLNITTGCKQPHNEMEFHNLWLSSVNAGWLVSTHHCTNRDLPCVCAHALIRWSDLISPVKFSCCSVCWFCCQSIMKTFSSASNQKLLIKICAPGNLWKWTIMKWQLIICLALAWQPKIGSQNSTHYL